VHAEARERLTRPVLHAWRSSNAVNLASPLSAADPLPVRRRRFGTWALAIAWTVSCGEDPPGDDGTASAAEGTADDGIASLSAGTAGDDAPTTMTGAVDDTGAVFDVGNGMEEAGDEASDMGCSKVDVVISVDNSSSMTEEIEALQGPVFAAFPQALLDINNGLDDFQLGLIDACPKPAALQDSGTAGPCGYSTGRNYMVSTSGALAQEFACATELPFMAGWSGADDTCEDSLDDDEQPAFTGASVVSAPFVDDQNMGFVRPDAVLMIVAITDEDEALVDANDATEIYDKIVAAKGGDVNAIAFMGVAGGSDCDGAYGSANDAVAMQELAQMFASQGRGMFWDLCQGQLEVGFQMFIQTVVDSACMDFVPPG